ncbi:serine protease [Citromicrobium bathyomarinum]|uniref:S1 family peptidase n=1 Tax=Sphingomonadales TaxID=204457 RepID=UPI00315A285A|tara:strand:- start:2000 stop:3655 length:1656 start_codon:yes stop_codon:yes gene_type:complete
MTRILFLLAILLAALAGTPAHAEAADIDAAARGVVRVVIFDKAVEETGEEQLYPVSHGTGFAVSPQRIITNAHVVREAMSAGPFGEDRVIGIVPPDGDAPAFARIVAIDPGTDLALLAIQGSLRMPPLTLAANKPGGSGDTVTSVGYPMNVDRAQGLSIQDIVRSQPPVKSRGFISGERPSRQFDTILHTAPIARGNSGGPLLDNCGRVLGVNSFGAESDGTDAEFYFAVSNRELLPFLRAHNVSPRLNDLPCRSLAELDEAERQRRAAAAQAAREQMEARSEAASERRARLQLEAEMEVQEERENRIALSLLLLIAAIGLGVLGYMLAQRRERELASGEALPDEALEDDPEWDSDARKGLPEWLPAACYALAAICVVAAAALYLTRPGLDAIDRRVAAALEEETGSQQAGDDAALANAGKFVCTLEPSRSRVTGDAQKSVSLRWSADGCVNGRTQYGFAGGQWARVFVPNEEDIVSVARYDPETRTYRADRYLLSREAIAAAREARGSYSAPSCDAPDGAAELGRRQDAVLAALPSQPNERLVYTCQPAD